MLATPPDAWGGARLTGRARRQHDPPVDVTIETERMVLRAFNADDVDNLVELDGDPEVMRYLTGGQPTSREAVRTGTLPWLMARPEPGGASGGWAAVERSTGAFLGWFSLRAGHGPPDELQLGYRLRRSAWGRGYATEGSRALIDRAFSEFAVRRVWATTMAVNTRSRRAAEKAGMTHTRTYHEHFDDPIPGTEHGEVEYAVTRADWESAGG